jgi:sugar phosphate isomerase/epimerase
MDQLRLAICSETFPADDWSLSRAIEFAAECGYTGWEVAPFTMGAAVQTLERSAEIAPDRSPSAASSSVSEPLMADRPDAQRHSTLGGQPPIEVWNGSAGSPSVPTAWRDLSTAQRRSYRRSVERAGLQIVGLHWLLAQTEGLHLTAAERATRLRTADVLIDLAHLCADLGGQVLVLGSPQQRSLHAGTSHREGMLRAAETLAKVVPTLERSGVVLALEPLGPTETNFLNSADDARELARQIESPQIGLHLDVKAMSSESVSMERLIHEHADWLVHFHANDPNRQGPGMGDVAVAPYLDALRSSRYQGWVSVEVFDYAPGAERLALQSARNLHDAWQSLPVT